MFPFFIGVNKLMTDLKISQQPLATTVELTDNFVVARNGTNVRIPASTLYTKAPTYIATNQVTEQVTASGALDISKSLSEVVTTNSQINLTLSGGTHGQEKVILFRNKGTADVVITPNLLIGGTTITLNATGQTVTLRFVTNAWAIVAIYGGIVA
jgi:hypothetical protein